MAPRDKGEQKEDAAEENQAGEEEAPMEEADEQPEEQQQQEEKKNGSAAEAEPEQAEEEEQEEELEVDAPLADDRPKIQAHALFRGCDATLNAVPSCGGKVLLGLSDGGLHQLVAAARANVGLRAGRHLFEVRIVESRSPAAEAPPAAAGGGAAQQPPPRAPPRAAEASGQLCRLGFTAAGSSLFLGGSEDGVGFDSGGGFLAGTSRTGSVAKRFVPHSEVLGLLLNLGPGGKNAHTVSLFRDGVRACKPQPLPESLRGKALFPTVNFKNMTLHVHFGPAPIAPLPFRCLTLQQAAAEDAQVAEGPPEEAEGRREVLLPVGLPDEGTFGWLEGFLKSCPDYAELSARALLNWALNSGLKQQKTGGSNDRPTMDFGVRELDDGTLLQTVKTVAPSLKRNCVVMEVRDNLLASGRRRVLEGFDGADFRKVAVVAMGEPPEEHKAAVRQLLLQEKRARAADEVKLQRQAAERKKAAARDGRPPLKMPRSENGAEDRGEEEALEDGGGGEERPAEEAEGEEQKKEPAEKEAAEKEAGGEGEKQQEEAAPEETLEEAVLKAQEAVELSEEEKRVWFRKPLVEDLGKKELGQSFANFSLPSADEGFDEVRFAWQPEEACMEYLKAWIAERKLTQRVEDLQPGAWFREQWQEWGALLQQWRARHGRWQDPARPPLARPQSERRRKQQQQQGEEGAEEGAVAQKGEEEAAKEGGEEPAKGKEAEEAPKEAAAKAEDAPAPGPASASDLDVFAVEDVSDAAAGEPLFAHFSWEDWMLLSLRFEVHLLAHAYGRDLGDPERPSFPEAHLAYYYGKYFKKQLTLKYYGVSTELELLELIKDTIEVTPKNSILDPQLSADTPMDNFVRLTEDMRRERQRRIDAGDETAVLKFQKPPPRQPPQQQQHQQPGRGGSYQSRAAPQPAASHSRGGGPPNSRSGPPPHTRYGSGTGAPRSGSGGYSSGGGSGSGGGGSGGYGSRGAAPAGGRYGAPSPGEGPASRSYQSGPKGGGSSYSGGGSGQKRSYPPPAAGTYTPYKSARTSSGPQTGRGSGGGYGSSGHSSGGYRR